MKTERVVLCEGEADLEFWLGWLTSIGCTDPTNEGRKRVLDPWGRPVPPTQGWLHSKSGVPIRLVKCGDRFQVLREGKRRFDLRATAPTELMVLSMDGGVSAKDDLDRVRKTIGDRVEQWHERATRAPEGDLSVDGTWVAIVAWGTNDPPKDGVPQGQTLERVVASAIVSAYPDRGAAVHAWLEAAPRAQFLSHESYLLSYVAKWWPGDPGPRFFRKVWQEPELIKRLGRRLQRIDAWRVGERLAE